MEEEQWLTGNSHGQEKFLYDFEGYNWYAILSKLMDFLKNTACE